MAKRRRKKKSNFRYAFLAIAFLVIALVIGVNYYFKPTQANQITEVGSLPDGFVSHGIDISHHQGEVDWDLFNHDRKIGFVYCKATEGLTFVDSHWPIYSEKLEEKGVAYGAYHFFHPSIDPIEQAKHFLNHIDLNHNHLPPVLDIETDESNPSLVSGVLKWLTYVEQKTGRRPIIYTSYHFYKNHFKHAISGYQYWIANYTDYADRFIDDTLVVHWQYSESGKVAGFATPVDLNYSKIDFGIAE